MENKYQIVYSRKITKELMKQGFVFEKSVPNPDFPQYNCWLFENTDEFKKVFQMLTKKGDRHG